MHPERILIVGGGVAGLSLAHALGRAGAGSRVTLLERERAFGQHSSGSNAAILRTAIDAPATRRLVLRSARRLRAGEGFPVPLVDEVGLLVATDSAEPAWLADHGDEVEVARHARRAPHWRPAGRHVWHLPRCGRLDVAALIDGLASGARSGGVTLRTGTPLAPLHEAGDLRGVRTAAGESLEADVVVLAAGAWVDLLAPGTPSGARVTRRHLLVTEPDARIDPRWPVVWDDVAGMYARPESGGLLVCACDVEDVHPDRRIADPDVKVAVAEKVAAHLPAFADAGAAHFWAGLRTLTVDDVPLIGPDPRRSGLFWLAGLGGHGMTLALSVGELAADLLLDRPVDAELRAAVDPSRLALHARV